MQTVWHQAYSGKCVSQLSSLSSLFYPSKENRVSTDRVKCRQCGYEGHADTCAAKEILRRRSGEIPLYAPPGKVFEMLMVQYKRGLEVPQAPPFSLQDST